MHDSRHVLRRSHATAEDRALLHASRCRYRTSRSVADRGWIVAVSLVIAVIAGCAVGPANTPTSVTTSGPTSLVPDRVRATSPFGVDQRARDIERDLAVY